MRSAGILAACLASGAPLRAALSWAVTGAALSTLGPGARGALPTQPEVGQLMSMVTGRIGRGTGHAPRRPGSRDRVPSP